MALDDKTIKELDQQRQRANMLIAENEKYVKGCNPETLNEPPQKKPDNRITIPFAKMAVETLCGYAGRAGDITEHWDNVVTPEDEKAKPGDDEYIELRKKIAEHNETALETSQLYEVGCSQGESYELFWTSTELDGMITPEYTKIPNTEVVLVWSNDIKKKLTAALRFWSSDKDCYLDAYYPEKSERWEKKKGTDTWSRNKQEDTDYPYKSVPLAIYPINSDSTCIFQAEKDIITGNDKLLNKSVNEVDRFNALIILLPQLADKEFVDKLRDIGVIDALADETMIPQYLQKNLSGVNEFYKMVSDRLEKLFHKSIKIPDFSDENFVNAQSGLAMAFKLVGLEFLAAKIDMYFHKGIKKRNELINDVLRLNSKLNVDDYKLTIESKRNLPMDKAALIEMVVKLNGILSKETLLRMLPVEIVPDVEKELEMIGDVGIDLDAIPKIEE